MPRTARYPCQQCGLRHQWLAVREPLNRLGSPVEIANTIDSFASDEASLDTGAAPVADGGWSARSVIKPPRLRAASA
jgi:NAD(P)-dependent dehydrogenase (short-subunit alcohol dehydrogenase family)